ncbi:hypothetical protein EV363DRAFT_1354299 [Boletus edulis]|nr:hypothetical protein EV363DRAFT_1354299 [Boletus edulis]
MMTFSSLRSLRATSVKHHDRALTLVFGSDGQVSLIGFDGGIASQAPYTLTVSNTGTPTPPTRSLPSESSSVSPIPNLEATSASLTGTVSPTPVPTSSSTFITSSFASSSYDPSSNATETDTDLPSIPTVNFPTPSPTPVSNPRDHGVGAPFYLAIVLASISFIGCVAAFIAWWIRSRTRRHDLELDDPWNSDTISDTGTPSTDNANASDKGALAHVETQTRPYYLPASIVRRSSSNLLTVPHTIPSLEDGTLQNGTLHAGRYPSLRRANDPWSQNPSSEPNPYSRPGTERFQSGLSVQESTRTLGRLRVANRVPGDVTSGDEGGTNMPRIQHSAGLSTVPNIGMTPSGENAIPNPHPGQGDRPLNTPLEPPGPATIPWGRRMDTVAALRRTRQRTPGTTVQTYSNVGYGGRPYPALGGGSNGAMWQAPAVANQEEKGKDYPPEPLDWKSTLKSSFWQAVDAMTGSGPSDPESHPANAGSGSRFTPAPQRVASRRSPVSPTRLAASSTLPDIRAARAEGTETKYELTPSDKSVATQEILRNSTHLGSGNFATGMDESEVPRISEFTIGSVRSSPPRVSRLNRNLGISARRQHPDFIKADTGSVYSTDSAVARANLRKYGYGDPIPSSWSALGAARESQLDLERTYLPLPRPIPSSSPSPLSITPSQLTLDSGLLSSSVSTRARARTDSDFIGSDAATLRLGENANPARDGGTTSSTYSTSRNGTMESGHRDSTAGHGTVPLPASSTTSSMLSRKKGITTRRKRPIPPQRAQSSASSVQSIESGLSIREVAVRRALLERRKKVKAANSLKGREDGLTRSRDASSPNGDDTTRTANV